MCKNGSGKEIEIQLKQNKELVATTDKEKKENILEQVKAGNIQRTKKYKYLGIKVNGNSKRVSGNSKWKF